MAVAMLIGGRDIGQPVVGRWRWDATCELRNFTGVLIIEDGDGDLRISHGGTNFWDTGTINEVKFNGRRLSFHRRWGPYLDRVNLTLSRSGGGLRMTGVLPKTDYSGRCELTAAKN